MADETISTRIVANADFSALIADVHKVTASLSRLQEKLASSNKMMANQIAVMNRSFSDTLRSTGQFSTHFVSLTSDVEKFGKNLDGGKLKLNQYFNAFRDQTKTSGGLIRDLAKQQVALQNSVLQPLGRNAQGLMQFNVHVPRGLDTVKNAAAIARTELQIMNKVVQDGAGQIINFGKNTQWTGRQLTVGLTVPLVAFGNAAAKAFREADQELVRLTKVYGDIAGTSAAELGKVRDDVVQTAREISSAMGVSFKETIALAADIAATGKTGDELLGSIKETTRLAVLGEVDRQEAMKATLAIQTAFKQNTDELANSINFLNAVENQTSTTLNDLVEAIPKAGPVVKALGGDIQDLALYLTAMREGGINAAEGANAIKSSLASLINPTKVAKEMFNGLGIDLEKIVQGNAGNITATIMELQGALDQLDPLSKTQAIEQLFGKFQFARLSALFENLGKEGSQTLQVLDLMKASSDELSDVAGRELTAVTESASGKYRRALEGLKASLAEVGEQFLTINTVLITVIDKIVQFAMNLPGPVKQILALLGGVTAIAGPLIMLTGLLANFFGNMAKGVFHLRAFFKGGEGFKYLTPEMLAAEKAGKLVEQSFYSDAKAAAVLQQALRNLLDEFSLLEAKAKSGSISVNPAVNTMAGNLVMSGGGRIVDPSHPLVGKMGTRASSHMVPRSGMTEAQRLQQTMFGMVPGSGPVNQKIGQNPQIYMNDQLPNVAGLTTVNGVSTGVVAGEAARHHAMMATLGMQSKAEIEVLKKQMVATGVLTKDFMNQFDDILPIVSRLTDNAARESALIVAELRAGKLNVEQAKAKIIALNLETERMIASSMQTQAISMGRTLNPTIIPTLNQPVVDPTGKSNMRELFKKGSTRNFINKVAGALGVRTSGAGYNIETTKPRRLNSGGYVYTMNDGNIVPGPNVNRDVVPAMLTPGEFVVNAESTKQNLPLLKAINSQSNSDLPIGYMPSSVSNSVIDLFGERQKRGRVSSRPANLVGRYGMIMPQNVNDALAQKLNSNGALGSDLISLLQEPDRLIDLEDFLSHNGVDPKDINTVKRQVAADMASKIQPNGYYSDGGFGRIAMESTKSAVSKLENSYPGINLKFQKDRMTPGRRDTLRRVRSGETQAQANSRGGGSPTGMNYLRQRPSNYGSGATRGAAFGTNQVYGHFADQEMQKNTSLLARSFGFARQTPNLMAIKNAVTSRSILPRGRFTPGAYSGFYPKRNKGGIIGMNMGGLVPRMGAPEPVPAQTGKYNDGGMVQYLNQGGQAGQRGSGMAASFGGMGLMAGGSMVGGTAGQVMSSAGMAMTFMPMLQMLPKVNLQLTEMQKRLIQPIGPLNRLNAGIVGKTTNLKGLAKAFGPVLRGLSLLLRAFNPIGLAIAASIFAVKKLIDVYKDQQESLRINRLEFGLSADAMNQAGYSMTEYGANIKKAIEDSKALQERNKMLYESMFQANIPIKMTIAEYKKLRDETKKKMPDLIELFNQKSNSEVAAVAARLKAQFMSLGDSAEVATAKVFALISQSDKAQLAAGAIGTKGFASIKTSVDAAVASAGTFDDAMAKGDSKAATDSLLIAFEGIGHAIEDNAKTNKIEFGESMDQVLKKMAASGKGQVTINKSVLDELKKQNPELAKILNSTDTATSAWAKYQLALQGVNLDLQTLSGSAAKAALELQALVVSNTTATLKNSAGIKDQYAKYEGLQKRIKDLTAASRGQSAKQQIDSRKVVEGLNEQIKKIKDAADAKIKALRSQSQAENDNLELQKLQLEYQEAIARGDQDAAARSQIAIQQLTNQVQTKKAEESIIAKAELEIKPLQDQLDKLGKKNQELSDKAALAGESLSKLQSQAEGLKDKLSGLEKALSSAALNKLMMEDSYEGSSQQKTDLAGVESFNAQLGGPKSVERVIPKGAKARHRIPETFSDVAGGAKDLLNQTVKTMQVQASVVNLIGDIKTSGKSGALSNLSGDRTSSSNALQVPAGTIPSHLMKKDGQLSFDGAKSLVSQLKLEKGQFFKYNGITYEVLKTGWGFGDRAAPVKRSLGGAVTPGRRYEVNDRINALGRQQEVFMPTVPGMIKPNINTAFDIPSQQGGRMSGISNSPHSNNTYNIDIELNGTTVSADDVMRALEAKMKLVGATLGRPITVGGNR